MIVGVGLIGGSIGLAVRKRRLARTVIGLDRDPKSLDRAAARGAIDPVPADRAGLKKAVGGADLVILAVPVGRARSVARELAPWLAAGTIVTDVGSVKGPLVRDLEEAFAPRVRFVGGHPIAGREKSGVEAASPDLFSEALFVLTPTSRTKPEAIRTVRRFWEALGSRVVTIDPDDHDRILAAVSHLPHLIAYALVNTLFDLERRNGDLLSFSAGGFRDFARIAASSPRMWRDICLANRKNLTAAIGAYESRLGRLKQLLAKGNGPALEAEFEAARAGMERSDPRRKHGIDHG